MALNPGDIAFVEFNADNPDSFEFVALVDISEGEVIHFTDNGWQAAGGFRANEGVFSWTAPAGGVSAGAVVEVDDPSGLALSTSGDQILAYQGDVANPTFIAAVQFGETDWNADATDANSSALPAGLTNGATAVAVGNVDNGIYSGPLMGDRATLLAALNDPTNWTTSETPVEFGGSFTLGSVAAPTVDLSSYVQVGRYDLPVPMRTPGAIDSELALEASAVTYNPDTDTLFVVGDEGTAIVQVSKTGQLIDSMTLESGAFDDPEGLTYAGNGQFILVEERSRQANRFTYQPNVTLTRNEVETVKLGTTIGNVGLEGISADPQTGGFVLVKEIDPQGVFQTEIDFVAGTATNGSPTTENAVNLFDPTLMGLTDIADVYALANLPAQGGATTDGNLLVLSQEDGRIVNVDRNGTVTSSLNIAADPSNPLSVTDQGHEGVTMDGDGILYVVNERGGGDSEHPQLWVYAPASTPQTNQAPVAVSLANALTSLAENSDTGTRIKVGNIIVSDDSLGSNRLGLAGADADAFEIEGTELFLRAGTVLDFETQPSYEIVLTVDDTTVGGTPDATSRAFSLAIADTTDSPAALIISEVAPWSSGNSPGVGADWFEVTNTSTAAVDITGWRIDDDSANFANSSALDGVTQIEPGQSVIFVDGDETTVTAFINTWFGGTAPSDFAIGTYGGPGLGTGGDAVNLFDASGTLVTGVSFGASPTGPFATFDNKAGLPAVATLSEAGINGAFSILDGAVLTGSPGTIVESSRPLTTLVAIAATDATAAEAEQNPGEFTIFRTGDTAQPLEVTYAISGDATNGTDYAAIDPTTVTIPAGASEARITITPVEDGDAEATETVTLTLVDTAAYDLTANASATVEIVDNDTPLADFNLQVTEIWSGQAGADVTADWFEITNTGTEAWVAGISPDLFYDDESADPADADPILGLSRIEPGQSAIVVVGGPGDATAFRTVWSPVIDLDGVEVGSTDGAGLGNGDAVTLFVGVPAASTIADNEAYPADGVDAASFDVATDSFSIAGQNGAIATLTLGGSNGDVPAVGSPGNGAAIGAIENSSVVINEVDADTPGSDAAEFVELYDGGAGNTPLDGLSLVFFNGNGDSAYATFDLDGFSTDGDGYFVLGNPGVANVDLIFEPGGSGLLQNGADAVALYRGDAADFPSGTAATIANLQDAIAYDTNDNDDVELLAALGLSTQFNEDENGNKDNESNSRMPNGSGSFVAQAPTPGAENIANSGVVTPPPSGTTLISAIQGSGTASPLVGQSVTVEAVVVGDFQDGSGANGDLNGFLLQEQDADADNNPLTSEGIFVFDGNSPAVDVEVGNVVRVTGTVAEFFGETQLSNVTVTVVDGSDNSGLVTPATITFPVASTTTNSDGELIADLEAFEGMLVTIPQELTIADLFTLGRFGDMGLHADGRLEIFSQGNSPSLAGFQAYQELAVRNTITLDDGSSIQNPAVIPFEIAASPGDRSGQLDANDQLRSGDTVSDLTGVLRFSRGSGGSGDEIYRLHPTANPVFVNDNPRPSQVPNVGGDITIASFNVLNFFTTLDQPGATSGPNGLEPRGAEDLTEFERQVAKLVAAFSELQADIFGLVEIENEFGDQNGDGQFAIQFLVNQLNQAIPGANYQFVDPGQGFIDTGDAISVGLIYNANSVEIAPGTQVAVLTDSDLAGLGVDPGNPVFDGPGSSRAPLAVSFEEKASGEVFTVAVNHFKSKGSISPFGNNRGIADGAGNNNEARLQAAIALDAWLDSDPTGAGDEDVLIIGDLNAYGMEDPIQFLLNEGYVDQVKRFLPDGEFEYSFAFPLDLDTSPQVQAFGALDYALASGSLAAQVTGAAEWHINADESVVFDYNTNFKPQAQIDGLFGATPFRASDHDPIILGLSLAGQSQGVSYGIAVEPNDRPEGNSGSSPVTFTVTRTGTTQGASTVDYSFGGTADSRDYSGGTDGTVSFGPGETSRTITVEVQGDTEVEADETIEVTLSNGTIANGSATIATGSAVHRILNDDTTQPPSQLVSLGLYNAVTDELIQRLKGGDVIQLDAGTRLNELSIVAIAPEGGALPEGLESVKFDLNGTVFKTENIEPYALFGDQPNNNFNPGTLPVGSNSITADLFTGDRGSGELIDSLTINFTLETEAGEPPTPSEIELGLFDASRDRLIQILNEGDQINARDLPTSLNNLTILAFRPDGGALPSNLESVVFDLNGSFSQTENLVPYALFGDRSSTDFNGGPIPLGSNRITAQLFDQNLGRGNLIETLTRNFSIVGESQPQPDLDIGLYDADTNELIELLEDNDSLKASQVEGRNLTLAAFVPSDSIFGNRIESMRLDFNNGQLQKLENIEPYALFGDDPRGDFNGGSLSLSENNRISFTLFSQDGGTGTPLGTVTRTFQVELANVV